MEVEERFVVIVKKKHTQITVYEKTRPRQVPSTPNVSFGSKHMFPVKHEIDHFELQRDSRRYEFVYLISLALHQDIHM